MITPEMPEMSIHRLSKGVRQRRDAAPHEHGTLMKV
jgi:hypothetical protein